MERYPHTARRQPRGKEVVDKEVSELQGDARVLYSKIEDLEKRTNEKIAELKEATATKKELSDLDANTWKSWTKLLLPILTTLLATAITAGIMSWSIIARVLTQ